MKYATLKSKTYTGGKEGAGIPHKLINQIPPHETYVAGFLGHDAVLRYKKPALKNIGYELNKSTLQTWSDANFTTDLLNWNNLTLLNKSFLDFDPLSKLFQSPKTYLYLDPPYIISSRMGKKKLYKFELTDEEHFDLLQKIKKCRCIVGINHYYHPMYEEELKDWRVIKYLTTTRGATTTEYFYMNYDAPTELHDYDYLGNDKREREAIKRRFTTFKKRLIGMEKLEQLKYLEYVKEEVLR